MDSIPQPTTPAYIGHYHLLEPIGRGGMGLVFRARDTRLEREVAIKCLRTELFEAHYIERFKREALLLAKLNHPNIVQIYDFIEAPDQLALVMELVDGQNLQTYLREHIVPMSQRLHWLTQIAEGLAIAHDAGIIHRDLKAENILINKRGQSKITDLGIAKSQDFNATLTDHVAGSYCSMSPEQAMGEDISFKSDLFSLGILAYQLLCGAHPFGDTGNKLQIMQRIISHPPTPPHQHNPDLPAEFVDLLGQLLSKDPNKRPDNTHWVAAQFKKLSTMNVHDNIASDDTQALAIPQPNIARSARTQDHPTFETRFVAVAAPKISLWKKLKDYIAANKIVVGSAALSALMITGVIVWQLQPKPPKYVAVIPPKLTAEGMQESQQELVIGAVYDAIQQSVIQLDGYYLIPQNEIADVNGSNDDVRKATAADELITSEIQCKIEACTIILTKLSIEPNKKNNRLKVDSNITIDIATNNFLSITDNIQNSIEKIYSRNLINNIAEFSPDEYAIFLQLNHRYRAEGESQSLIEQLDNLGSSIKKTTQLQLLYTEISLDLYHETKNILFLEKAEKIIESSPQKNELSNLLNLFQINLAKNNITENIKVIEKIKEKKISSTLLNQLNADLCMAKKEYQCAIKEYQKALNLRETADLHYKAAIAYWYAGNTKHAKMSINNSLSLSPYFYNALSFTGTISLLEGDTKSAIISFKKILDITPDDTFSISNLGLAYFLERDYINAKQYFNNAKRIAPENSLFILNLADAENLLGNKRSAEKLYNLVIEKQSKQGKTDSGIQYMSQAYAHLGKSFEALSLLRELEKRSPQNIETIYTASLVNTLTKNKQLAALNIKEALDSGMNKIWFSVPWFDDLCENDEFIRFMIDYGEPNRCPPI